MNSYIFPLSTQHSLEGSHFGQPVRKEWGLMPPLLHDEGFIVYLEFVWVGNLSLPNLFNYLYQYGPVNIHFNLFYTLDYNVKALYVVAKMFKLWHLGALFVGFCTHLIYPFCVCVCVYISINISILTTCINVNMSFYKSFQF